MAVVDSGRRTSSGAVIWKAAPSSSSSSSGSSGGGGSSKNKQVLVPSGRKTKSGATIYVPAPSGTKFYQKTVGGGYRVYNPSTKQYETRAKPPTAAEAKSMAAEERRQQEAGEKSGRVTEETAKIRQLRATTTQKEKQVMMLQYGIQQGMFSQRALAKARQQQAELMKDLPEKKPVETAFELGGKTFVGTYGLKRVKVKPKEEEKAPAIYTGIPRVKKEEKPTIPKRQKEWEETVDIITPAPIIYTDVGKGTLVEYKAPEGKWAGTMYDFRKGLETKEIELIRKGDPGLARIYGFGSAVTYPFRTPESTFELGKTFGKGFVFGYGTAALGVATGPVIPTIILYGSSIYGATQAPKLQEEIAEAKFHSLVAYREKLAETGEHAAAAIGGAYVGSLLVPATITSYKKWHHKMLTSKGATTKKGDYVWKKNYYSDKALKDWEKTLAESKFISEAQKHAALKRVGGKPAVYKKQDFFSLKEEQLGLPSQPIQTQIIPKKHFIEPTTKMQLELSEATRIHKWVTRPSLKPKSDIGMSFPKFKGHMEQYQLYDTTGASFFESSYFRTGYYKPVPRLLLEYKPVGKVEMFKQWITNIKYPKMPIESETQFSSLFSVGREVNIPSHVWEKGDIYTGLIPEKKPIVIAKPSVVEKLWFYSFYF